MTGRTTRVVGVAAVLAMTLGILAVFLQDDMVTSSVGVVLTIAGLMGVMFAVRYSWEDTTPGVGQEPE